ncbi:MAG: DUF2271 domain-containing protein [Treponema sp.]|nr:DUF2271 domain-containing protein [Treponema sp.]
MKKIIAAVLFTSFCAIAFAAKVTVRIEPGTAWKKRAPQCAVWIEDENHEYLGTVFVTKSASKKTWKFSPKQGRPESLPVWYNSTKISPDKPADKTFDAVTSATPKKNIIKEQTFPLKTGKTYFVVAEVNQSFDYNEHWTKKNSDVNGQPSVIYAEQFTFQEKHNEFLLHFTGTGSIDGKSGIINKSNEQTLSTAKEIISEIQVYVE